MNKRIILEWVENTERCCYNAVNFLPHSHKIHPIACPLGRAMGCILRIQTLIYALPQLLNHATLDRVITALDYFYASMEKETFEKMWEWICQTTSIHINSKPARKFWEPGLMQWLLMPWLLALPGHHQPWYWIDCWINISLPWERISDTCIVIVWKITKKIQINRYLCFIKTILNFNP